MKVTGNEAKQEKLLGSSCLTRFLFGFISPVIRMARTEGQLQEQDVPEHTTTLDTKVLHDFFNKEWQRQQTKEKPSMTRALISGRTTVLLCTGMAYIVSQALQLAGPLLLKQIVSGLSCLYQGNEQAEADAEDNPACEGGALRLYLYASSTPLFVRTDDDD
jgi:hypothetical protein